MANDTPGSVSDNEKVRDLLLAAFAAARRSGKPEWQSMTAAVLKNRLLDLTSREFDTSQYGASSFLEFVSSFPDLLAVDRAVSPQMVTLLQVETTADESSLPSTEPLRGRVRPDLWRAILDYTSGATYLWDPTTAAARATRETEDLTPDLALPTIDEEEMSHWRSEFAERHRRNLSERPQHFMLLEGWRSSNLGTYALPPALRGPWNGFLKEKVIQRLRDWFELKGFPQPEDLVEQARSLRRHTPSTDEDPIRAFVVDCVRTMTLEELRSLQLPAAAVVRANERRLG